MVVDAESGMKGLCLCMDRDEYIYIYIYISLFVNIGRNPSGQNKPSIELVENPNPLHGLNTIQEEHTKTFQWLLKYEWIKG